LFRKVKSEEGDRSGSGTQASFLVRCGTEDFSFNLGAGKISLTQEGKRKKEESKGKGKEIR